MTAELRELDIADPAWAGFVRQHPAATAFHVPAWAQVLRECYGYRTSALVLTDDAGRIRAGLPLMRVRRPLARVRGVCLPFTDNCAPLTGGDDGIETLARPLAAWRSRIQPGGLPLHIRAPMPESSGWVSRQVGVLHTLKLSADSDAVFRTFKRTQVQQSIVKAERAHVTVRRATSVDDLRAFFDLHLHTRRRLGAPVQPGRFFRLIWDRLVTQDLGFLLIARYEGVPIAGALFLAWNKTLIYKYSASDHHAWSLRPNNLVLWTAIRWACENGFASVDFGRTDLDNRGLRAFKNGWGTREEPLVYATLDDGRTTHATPGLRLRPLATRLAGALIRRSPAWVCRMLGEVLYRYAA